MNLRAGGRNDSEANGRIPAVASLRSQDCPQVRKGGFGAGRPFPPPIGTHPAVPGRAPFLERTLNFPRTEYVVESTHQRSNHGTGGQNADS